MRSKCMHAKLASTGAARLALDKKLKQRDRKFKWLTLLEEATRGPLEGVFVPAFYVVDELGRDFAGLLESSEHCVGGVEAGGWGRAAVRHSDSSLPAGGGYVQGIERLAADLARQGYYHHASLQEYVRGWWPSYTDVNLKAAQELARAFDLFTAQLGPAWVLDGFESLACNIFALRQAAIDAGSWGQAAF